MMVDQKPEDPAPNGNAPKSPVDLKAVKEIFDRATEIPIADRATFLDRECSGFLDVRKEVELLLESDANAGGFMSGPTQTSEPTTSLGQIGRYKLQSPRRRIGVICTIGIAKIRSISREIGRIPLRDQNPPTQRRREKTCKEEMPATQRAS